MGKYQRDRSNPVSSMYNFGMESLFDVCPASDFSIPELADFMTRSFEGYFVDIHMDAPALLAMVRRDSVDLTSSRVLLANGKPAGAGLVARRGWASRVAGMGVMSAWRGKGGGSYLMRRLIEDARERNERAIFLEVIDKNDSAIHVYEKNGFRKIRRLSGFVAALPNGNFADFAEINISDAAKVISRFGYDDLPWQVSAENISLLARPYRAFQLDESYVVTSSLKEEHVAISSVLTKPNSRMQGQAKKLLHALFAKFPDKVWHVSAIFPEEMNGFFEKVGFQKTELGQFQMKLDL